MDPSIESGILSELHDFLCFLLVAVQQHYRVSNEQAREQTEGFALLFLDESLPKIHDLADRCIRRLDCGIYILDECDITTSDNRHEISFAP